MLVIENADLAGLAAQLHAAIKSKGFEVFAVQPAAEPALFGDDLTLLPTVDWESDDTDAFLEMGVAVGARLVYTATRVLSPPDLTQLDAQNLEARALSLVLEPLVGAVVSYGIGWVHDGVFHVWQRTLPAYEQLASQITATISTRGGLETLEAESESRDLETWAAREEKREQLATELALDPGIQDADSSAALRHAVSAALAERNDDSGEEPQFMLSAVARALTPGLSDRLAPRVAADPRFRTAPRVDLLQAIGEILPEWRHYEDGNHLFWQIARKGTALLEPELAKEAHALRVEGLTLAQIGGRIGRSANVISRLLAQYPSDPDRPAP